MLLSALRRFSQQLRCLLSQIISTDNVPADNFPCTIVHLFSDTCRYFDFRATFRSHIPWRRHDMETLSALLALCEGNPTVIGGFPSRRASNADFYVSFDIDLTNYWCFFWYWLNEWLNKHSNWDASVMRVGLISMKQDSRYTCAAHVVG